MYSAWSILFVVHKTGKCNLVGLADKNQLNKQEEGTVKITVTNTKT